MGSQDERTSQIVYIDGSEGSIVYRLWWKTALRKIRRTRKEHAEETQQAWSLVFSQGPLPRREVTFPGRRIAAKSLRASRVFLDEHSCSGSSAFEFSDHLPSGHRSLASIAPFRAAAVKCLESFVRRVAPHGPSLSIANNVVAEVQR